MRHEFGVGRNKTGADPDALLCVESLSPAAVEAQKALVDPNLSHSEPESWAASTTPHGTPGEENSTYVGPTAVAPAGAPPVELRLHPARPNPFNPSTTLRCGIAESGPVRLSIYDTSGRLVRQLLDGPREAGWYDITWDGRGDSGRGLVSGVYYGRLESAGKVLNQKLLLLK